MEKYAPSPGCTVVTELDIPIGSTCKSLEVVGNHLVAIFNIPDRGLVPFIICPETGTATEVIAIPAILGDPDFLG